MSNPQIVDSSSQSAPASGNETNVPAYFTVFALSILMWEVVSRSRRDVQVLRAGERTSLRNYTYVLSRLTTISYLVAQIIFQTAPVGSCSQAQRATSSLYILSILFTLILFYYRIRTAYLADRYISVIFGLLGLCVVGGCATLFPGTSGLNMGSMRYCVVSPSIDAYVSAFLIGPLLYTSFVFVLIAARQVESCQIDFTASNGLRDFIFKDCRSVLSRGLFEEGQIYYLTTVLIQLIALILFLLGSTLTTKIVLVSLNLAMMHILSCRGYLAGQERLVHEEKERKAKVMFSLMSQEPPQRAAPQRAYILGGIKITKTVEHFTV